MSSMRLRRLSADYRAIQRLVKRHPRIQIEGVAGNPPERYRFILHVRSLRYDRVHEEVRSVDTHRLEVTLPRGYPRDAPVCRMLTPVFHPNIAPHAVCVGDHWTAAERLDALVQRVGEMLAFQSYNTKSPLNGKAAQWVDENLESLPLDAEEFFVDISTLGPQRAESDEPEAARTGAAEALAVDAALATEAPAEAAGEKTPQPTTP